MVAWDRVITPKRCGGLGARNLHAQNQCLLLKLLHCLHSISNRRGQHGCMNRLTFPQWRATWPTNTRDMLRALLSMYQALSPWR
ncbi:hypothetical protein PR202_gb09691 [Eleusine coracana subsp. coracana]|uniref:Uncharacterized protein n=1 Tax=Eleusine coracana subsp. coracana TaxID=191504 RepID=A0AAV5EIP6_ELECO|nr:hypothetical protein PR202_gb09691 [Eleusine coracana subsp. coracana]